MKQLSFGVLYLFYRVISLVWQPRTVVALMYHSVSDEDWEFATPSEEFDRQIGYLRDQGFSCISVSDVAQWLRREKEIPRRSVLITFDDGYRDFYTSALPILRKYHSTATVFIHTNRSSDPLGNSIEVLSWEDVRAISRVGIEIGDHSHGHPNMKDLSALELEKEITVSKEKFQAELGLIPTTFAYPGGKFNATISSYLARSGYTSAFSISRGLLSRSDDPFTLRRFGLSRNVSWLEFKARLTPVSDWYEFLIKLVS